MNGLKNKRECHKITMTEKKMIKSMAVNNNFIVFYNLDVV